MKIRYSLSIIALSIIVSLLPMPVKAQVSGDPNSPSLFQTIVAPLINQFLTPSTNTTQYYLQMEQEFLQSHPNFQQQYPVAYNQLINDPQTFFSGQDYQGWNQGNWPNYQYQPGLTAQQMEQQFLQSHPNFQKEHPEAYNQLVNNPQAFFSRQNNQGWDHNWQNYQYQPVVTGHQREQQFLQSHPNFQREHPEEYNQLINNPQTFFSRQNNHEWEHNWENHQNQSAESQHQREQQFLQSHPNFQREHPEAYNQLINNPQAFYVDMHQKEMQEHNNNGTNSDQPQYGHRRHRKQEDYPNQ